MESHFNRSKNQDFKKSLFQAMNSDQRFIWKALCKTCGFKTIG